ncbi:MAG: polysaccharide pyruvyl transferase family protein [Candidatus Omnitrophota bacterium]
MRKKNNILISGGYGNGNAGDEALMICLLKQLRKHFPKGDFTIFSDNPQFSQHHYPDEKFIYSGRFGLLEPNEKGFRKITWIFQTIKAFICCSIFITGGGTILQDQTHPFFIPFWLFKILFAQMLFKKTALYGIGAGPITTRNGKILTRFTLNRMNFIGLRGHYSKKILRDIGVKDQLLKVTADPAITLTTSKTKTPFNGDNQLVEPSRLKVVFTIRRWYVKHLQDLNSKTWIPGGENKYNTFISECARLVDNIIETHNAFVFFVPMSCKPPNDDRISADDIMKIVNNKQECFPVNQEFPPQEIKGIIKCADLLIGMRFHSLIFFAETFKPMIGIAYGKKTYDFMNELGLKNFILDIENFSAAAAYQKITTALDYFKNTSVQSNLKEKISNQKAAARLNASTIFDLTRDTS